MIETAHRSGRALGKSCIAEKIVLQINGGKSMDFSGLSTLPEMNGKHSPALTPEYAVRNVSKVRGHGSDASLRNFIPEETPASHQWPVIPYFLSLY